MFQLQDQFHNTKKVQVQSPSSVTRSRILLMISKMLIPQSLKSNLFLQILRQLPPTYHSIFNVNTNMLLLHESCEATSDLHIDPSVSQSSALYASTNNSGRSKNRWTKNHNNTQTNAEQNSSGNSSEYTNLVGVLGNGSSL